MKLAGLLYQLIGEQIYADLAKKAMERALAGQRDRDDRYSFVNPWRRLRADQCAWLDS